MRVSMTEFRRQLSGLKEAAEPVAITKRGRYVGFYLSERAKSLGYDQFDTGVRLSRGLEPRIVR